MSTLELANSWPVTIRRADIDDAGQITHLLKSARLSHTHVDWRLPGEWIGQPGFVVAEMTSGSLKGDLVGCLSITADPPPAAWVRVASLADVDSQPAIWTAMFEYIMPELLASDVNEVGWLISEQWDERWPQNAGFRQANWIVSYLKEDLALPVLGDSLAWLRRAQPADMPALAMVERAAFAPLWRHSVDGLSRAYEQSLSFDIAEVDGQVAGFQYSVQGFGFDTAHLVRITVHPAYQGLGVGSRLLKSAIEGYRRYGIRRVSLNTQLDNFSSHKLYERFGFREVGFRIPVWVLNIEERRNIHGTTKTER